MAGRFKEDEQYRDGIRRRSRARQRAYRRLMGEHEERFRALFVEELRAEGIELGRPHRHGPTGEWHVHRPRERAG